MDWESFLGSLAGGFKLCEWLEGDEACGLFRAESVNDTAVFSKFGNGFGGGSVGSELTQEYLVELVCEHILLDEGTRKVMESRADNRILIPIETGKAHMPSAVVFQYAVYKPTAESLYQSPPTRSVLLSTLWEVSATSFTMHFRSCALRRLSLHRVFSNRNGEITVLLSQLAIIDGDAIHSRPEIGLLETFAESLLDHSGCTDQVITKACHSAISAARNFQKPTSALDFGLFFRASSLKPSDPTVQRDGRDFIFRWNGAKAGRHGVLVVNQNFPSAPISGRFSLVSVLSAIGSDCPRTSINEVRYSPPEDQNVEKELLPYCSDGRVVIFGQAIRANFVPDVSGIKVSRGAARLYWHWPRELEVFHIIIRDDRFPTSPSDIAEGRLCKKFAHQLANHGGGIDLADLKITNGSFVQIYGVAPIGDDRWLYSSGLPDDTRIRIGQPPT